MIDRPGCADGGHPDPTSTHGKNPEEAKRIELDDWDYPKHLEGRVYGVVMHGDVAGIEGSRRALCDWLDWMGLVGAGDQTRLDRFIGYYEPYATSHDTPDADESMQQEAGNVGRQVSLFTHALRRGELVAAQKKAASAEVMPAPGHRSVRWPASSRAGPPKNSNRMAFSTDTTTLWRY